MKSFTDADLEALDKYREKVERAMIAAIYDAVRMEDNTVPILTGEVTTACLNMIAVFVSRSDAVSTPAKTRIFCDHVAMRLRSKIAEAKLHEISATIINVRN